MAKRKRGKENQKEDEADHDGAYKTLFRQPVIVQQFLKHFAPGQAYRMLNLEEMETMSTAFVLKKLRRDSDCIWKIAFNNGEPLYLCLLLEFQSTVNSHMAVRVALYTALLYDHLIDTQAAALDGKLPPVLPIVLYNGKPPWSANAELANFYSIATDSGLMELQLHSKHLVIDLGRLTDDDQPNQPDIVSTLFEMERASLAGEVGRLEPLFDKLMQLTRGHPSRLALEEALLTFFEGVLRHRGVQLPQHKLATLAQVKQMFHNLDDVIEQSHQKGVEQGMRKLVLNMLVTKFNADPAVWEPRLKPLDDAQLSELASRIAIASSEDELDP